MPVPRNKLLVILIAWLYLTLGNIHAQDIAPKVDEYMNAVVRVHRFSGIVLVARDGRPVVSRDYGMANFELNVANTPKKRFRIVEGDSGLRGKRAYVAVFGFDCGKCDVRARPVAARRAEPWALLARDCVCVDICNWSPGYRNGSQQLTQPSPSTCRICSSKFDRKEY